MAYELYWYLILPTVCHSSIDTEVLRSSGVYELYQLCKSLKTVR